MELMNQEGYEALSRISRKTGLFLLLFILFINMVMHLHNKIYGYETPEASTSKHSIRPPTHLSQELNQLALLDPRISSVVCGVADAYRSQALCDITLFQRNEDQEKITYKNAIPFSVEAKEAQVEFGVFRQSEGDLPRLRMTIHRKTGGESLKLIGKQDALQAIASVIQAENTEIQNGHIPSVSFDANVKSWAGEDLQDE